MPLNEIGKNLPALLCALMIAILFIQSALDKVFDWKGNLGWLNEHFSKTFLRGTVAPMLGVLTFLELATGVLSLLGIIYFLLNGSLTILFLASFLGALTICALFFGQRIAKDYPGAAVLVPYFLLMILLMFFTNPFTHS